MKRVLVFGTFDRLHDGHRFLLSKARKLGNHLTVCLAQDEMVKQLKNHPPKQSLAERKMALKALESVDDVLDGDLMLGQYACVTKANPDVIAIGYDQTALREDLESWLSKHGHEIEIKLMDSYKPEIYKSSLLADNV